MNKPEPLKGKGTKMIELVDFIIGLFENQVKLLKKEGIDASMDIDSVIKLRKFTHTQLGEQEIYDTTNIKSAVEWLNIKLEELDSEWVSTNLADAVVSMRVRQLVKEAFEDVVK